jgi:hypothetical protein
MSRRSLSFCVVLWFSFCHPVLGDNVKTLREIEANLAANDSSLQTLVAEYDVVDRILAPSIDRNTSIDKSSLHQHVTESTVRVWLGHVEDRLRVEYEEKAGTRMLDETGKELIKEYSKEEIRYLKTPEHFVRFPVEERRIRVSGFPDVAGFGPGRRGRVLYRDAPDESEQYGNRNRFFDPRLVFSNGSLKYQRFCALYADALEGLRTEREQRHASSNLTINVREDGCIAVAVKYGGGSLDTEAVFDPTVGYQAVSFLSRDNGELQEEITAVYERKNGVFVPNNIKMKFYRDDSKGYIERHIQAVNLNVNKKIDDENFSLAALGLEYGDRMADSMTESLKVWTGDGFIDNSQFKMDNSRMPWGQGQLR